MRKSEKKTIVQLSTFTILSLIIMIGFSIPLFGIPPLGNLLFPGNGVWNVPGELPVAEQLNIPGLSGEVTVIRDEWGVPHIFADYEEDLFFAQGYCHAQDRLFQMDMISRQVRGRLSEILGESMIANDKFALAMGMEEWAIKTGDYFKEMYQNGTLDYYHNFGKYVDGINHYINSLGNSKPLEYHLLGFKPTTWTIIDSLCLVQEMARQMSWNYNDFYRYLTLEALNSTYFNELFGFPSPYQIPIVPDYGTFPESPMKAGFELQTSDSLTNALSSFLDGVQNIDSEKTIIENQQNEIIGSNNWVVNGTKTTTGEPILCNDMHLAWIMPGIWYEQHLKAEDSGLHVYGYSIPGMPLCAVGHNDYVAWGFTNTGYDVLDWYYYNTDGDDHYIYNGTSTAYTEETYSIKVKDRETEEFTIRKTVHGPVLSDFRSFGMPSSITDVVIAPQWVANGLFFNFLAGNGFDRAENRDDFNEASKYWTTLAQNIAYADVDGNIAIRPTGKVPIRDDTKIPLGNPGNGTIPYNGSNGEGEWIGFIPFDDLPHSINPSQNYLASANQIVAGPGYTQYFMQNRYANGYRARRINELLRNAPDGSMDLEKMKEIQNDVNSTAAQAFVPDLIETIKYYYGATPPTQINNILTELENWDFIMDKDEAAPTIYRKWRDEFEDFTFSDEKVTYNFPSNPQISTLEYLMKEDASSHWFDNILTPIHTETRNETMLIALNFTISWLENYYNSNDVSTWRWGDLHKLYFTSLTYLDALSKGPYEADGEGFTITPSGVNIESGTYARGGASERLIVDFSNLNNSLTVIPSGQRGLSNSKHYSDQLEQLFLQGKYHFQYYTNTLNNFPTSSVESKIYFYPRGG